MDVREEVVIHDANRHGAPVVASARWYRRSGTEAESAKVVIRCCATSSGV
jgi:hypothetical protein